MKRLPTFHIEAACFIFEIPRGRWKVGLLPEEVIDKKQRRLQVSNRLASVIDLWAVHVTCK